MFNSCCLLLQRLVSDESASEALSIQATYVYIGLYCISEAACQRVNVSHVRKIHFTFSIFLRLFVCTKHFLFLFLLNPNTTLPANMRWSGRGTFVCMYVCIGAWATDRHRVAKLSLRMRLLPPYSGATFATGYGYSAIGASVLCAMYCVMAAIAAVTCQQHLKLIDSLMGKKCQLNDLAFRTFAIFSSSTCLQLCMCMYICEYIDTYVFFFLTCLPVHLLPLPFISYSYSITFRLHLGIAIACVKSVYF